MWIHEGVDREVLEALAAVVVDFPPDHLRDVIHFDVRLRNE